MRYGCIFLCRSNFLAQKSQNFLVESPEETYISAYSLYEYWLFFLRRYTLIAITLHLCHRR